ncbi:MAG: hypothetical protein JKY63_05015 [Rhodobiaceae bacterium]|nr:hypothetical protein [Rhodobiaceae bacterium]
MADYFYVDDDVKIDGTSVQTSSEIYPLENIENVVVKDRTWEIRWAVLAGLVGVVWFWPTFLFPTIVRS